MKDHPILFSAPMVRANLEERKTQTRRAFSPQPEELGDGTCRTNGHQGNTDYLMREIAPRYWTKIKPGDRLWVREAWWIATRYSYGTTPGGCEVPPAPLAYRRSDPLHYAADGNPPNCANKHYGPNGLRPGSGAFAAPDPYAVWIKKPSIHMPRWASRLTLTVTGVKIERLQDISEEDAVAEGIDRVADNYGNGPAYCDYLLGKPHDTAEWYRSPIDSYRSLWDHINGPGAWDRNPWVVAYTYEPIFKNIDKFEVAA